MTSPQQVLTVLLIWIVVAPAAMAAEAKQEPTNDVANGTFAALWDEILQGASLRADTLMFGLIQHPVDSGLNPNNIQEIPRYQLELDVRPDIFLTFRRLDLSFKPRLEVFWREWQDGIRSGESETEADLFLNEWRVRYRISDELIASYGLENLQWGPSYLLSPSNPFSRNNGQNNPRLLVPRLDYFRLIWIPSYEWTLSFIANTDEGRLEQRRDFQETFALKLDYTGFQKYASLILSTQHGDDLTIGFFAGWSASDAILLYTEGRLSNDIDKSAILIGSAYTFAFGPTIAVEFFHDGDGCTLDPFELCFLPDMGDADFTDVLIRQNYLLLQYVHTEIWDRFNLTLRWIHNLDDQSHRLINVVDYEVTDHIQLFTIGTFDLGDTDAEFGSLGDYSIMLGVQYAF